MEKNKSLQNKSGQSLIEFLVTLPAVLVLILGLSLLSYRSFIILLADHFIEESFLCMESSTIPLCKSQLEKKLHTILFFPTHLFVEIKKELWPQASHLKMIMTFNEVPFGLRFFIPDIIKSKKVFFPIYKNL